VTRTAAKLLAQAVRLVAVALDHWHDEKEPEPAEKVNERELELQRVREQMRREGHRV
jgi:hypothetical protein